MRHPVRVVALFCLLLCAPLLAQPAVEVDREDAIYQVNEPITFRIATTQPVAYTISKDGHETIAKGVIEPAAEPATVTASLGEPGFVRIDIRPADQPTTRPIGQAAVAVDPTKIPPSLPVPDDFDAFWEAQKRKLAAEPMEPKLTPVSSRDERIEAFDVQVNCPGGAPLSGYFARPKGAAPKSLPIILSYHGAGVRSSGLNTAINDARFNALAMDLNAHGLPNGLSDAEYKRINDTTLKDYRTRDSHDREKIYFLGMYLRVLRSLEFMTAQPEWDGRTVIVRGMSQGGGQAIAAAALDSRVTLCLAAVPALCDLTGFAANRATGWPRMVKTDENGNRDARVVEAVRYVDGMNLATRIKADTAFTVGFIDTVCPPTNVYAAYNNLATANKRILNMPKAGHTNTPESRQLFNDAIVEHLREHGLPTALPEAATAGQ